MSSLGSILGIARNAIAAHQAALRTASHNLANAETPGFSRQRTELAAQTPQRFSYGSVGSGTVITNVIRMRSSVLDDAYRSDVGSREAWLSRREVLSELESIFAEPSDRGLTHSLDQFWSSWSDLSNNPSSRAAQSVVRLRGVQVAAVLNDHGNRIATLGMSVRSRLSETVAEINTLAGQVAEMNRQIMAAEVGGQQAPDLNDARDRLADRLAEIAGARSVIQANGTLGVYIQSTMLVDAVNARPLEVRGGTIVTLGLKNDPDPLVGLGGPLAAMIDLINVDLPAATARVDGFARALVNGVNEYHRSGWTAAGDALGGSNWNPLSGPTGSMVDFFDPAGTTGIGIRLSAAVAADASVIAPGDVQNAPGNNSVALAIGALRDDNGMAALQLRLGANFATQIGFASGESYVDHHAQTISDLGLSVADAGQQHAIHEALAHQADTRRASISGVSIDEELTLLMRHQQAYAAATKIVQAADEMAQAILAMV
jgi:flagellar hook-associated protein 1 FlgK